MCNIFLDPPRNSELSNCTDGAGSVDFDEVLTVQTEANPPVSEFLWLVNGSEFSSGDSISLGEDMIGQEVEVACVVFNILKEDIGGNDTATCVYTVTGMISRK